MLERHEGHAGQVTNLYDELAASSAPQLPVDAQVSPPLDATVDKGLTLFQHPFVLVEEGEKESVLQSTETGEHLVVPMLLARTALALGVGIEHEKTRNEILALTRPDELGRVVSRRTFQTVIYNTRKATRGYAPAIVGLPGAVGRDATFYYDAPPPEARDADFAWDPDATSIRYDARISYTVISHNGRRTGGRYQGELTNQLWKYMVQRPNQVVQISDLYDCVDEHYHKKLERIARTSGYMTPIRLYLLHSLKQPSEGLLQKPSSLEKSRGKYMLRADRVEIIGQDGRMRVVGEDDEAAIQAAMAAPDKNLPPPLPPVEPLPTRRMIYPKDATLLALSLRINQERIQKLLPALPKQIAFPNELLLADFTEGVQAEHQDTRWLVKNGIGNCLARLERLFDYKDFEEAFEKWWPSDEGRRDLLAFFVQFDQVRFRRGNEQLRGLEVLRRIIMSVR